MYQNSFHSTCVCLKAAWLGGLFPLDLPPLVYLPSRTSYNDVQNVMGALFICITFLGTSNSNGVQPVVAVERPVYYRELAAGGWCLRLPDSRVIDDMTGLKE